MASYSGATESDVNNQKAVQAMVTGASYVPDNTDTFQTPAQAAAEQLRKKQLQTALQLQQQQQQPQRSGNYNNTGTGPGPNNRNSGSKNLDVGSPENTRDRKPTDVFRKQTIQTDNNKPTAQSPLSAQLRRNPKSNSGNDKNNLLSINNIGSASHLAPNSMNSIGSTGRFNSQQTMQVTVYFPNTDHIEFEISKDTTVERFIESSLSNYRKELVEWPSNLSPAAVDYRCYAAEEDGEVDTEFPALEPGLIIGNSGIESFALVYKKGVVYNGNNNSNSFSTNASNRSSTYQSTDQNNTIDRNSNHIKSSDIPRTSNVDPTEHRNSTIMDKLCCHYFLCFWCRENIPVCAPCCQCGAHTGSAPRDNQM